MRGLGAFLRLDQLRSEVLITRVTTVRFGWKADNRTPLSGNETNGAPPVGMRE